MEGMKDLSTTAGAGSPRSLRRRFVLIDCERASSMVSNALASP